MVWQPARLTMMSDPANNTPYEAHAERLRALENEMIAQRRPPLDDGLDGIREYSRAWHEDRSTNYLLRKSWADPIARWSFIVGFGIIAAVWVYLFTQ